MNAVFRMQLPDQPRWARLRAHCAYHHDVMLIEWQTFDDGRVFTVETGNWAWDYLGYVPDEAEQERIRDEGPSGLLTSAVAEPAEGDRPHFRYHLRCPRPSCSYHQELTQPIAWLHDYVKAMWTEGIEQGDIWDLESWVKEQSG
jgi:hypothetical protein